MLLLKPSGKPEFRRLFSWPIGKDQDNLMDHTSAIAFTTLALMLKFSEFKTLLRLVYS